MQESFPAIGGKGFPQSWVREGILAPASLGVTETVIVRLLRQNNPGAKLPLEKTARGNVGGDIEASLPVALWVLSEDLSLVNGGG